MVQPKINKSETQGYTSPEAGPGSHIQAHCKDRLTKSKEIVTQQTILLDNIELQSTAKNMFKIDRTEYVFSNWFIEAKEIDLASVILETENKDKAMSSPNVILTKKTKPEFWIEIDKKFLVREVSKQSEQKINNWEKKMRISDAQIQDVAELEKILNTIFNNKKYKLDKYEEIEIVVYNEHAFLQNHHFPKDQIVEYYKNNTWEAINNALQVVDLAEQVFGANYTESQLVNKINEWHPISGKINDIIRQACVKYRHGRCWNAPSYYINNVICIDIKECYSASMRDQEEYTS
ncbi:7649_t:CDS:2 [Cetraspora pellucida]|uniref:7649_t:CDS:1 n=1 Tax=Cetraspora pellucida TaxID=1433469 RepID=A0A9N9A2C6_9GLOM|nr:7649_t:CDS:2 [Cetraspora pellucida]